MDDIYRRAIRKCYSYLVDNTDTEDLIDYLLQHEVLTNSIAEKINSITDRRGKMRKLLDVLPRRRNEDFSVFLDCLEKTHQSHIAKTLMDKLQEVCSQQQQQITDHNVGMVRGENLYPIACSEPNEVLPHFVDTGFNNYYKMDSNPRGLVLIINNETFTCPLEDRLGSTKDANDLKTLFSNFGFWCDVKTNFSGEEIKQSLFNFSQLDYHKNMSCCVIILMSHGEKDCIFGSGGQKVPVLELINYFSDHKCPNLKDKPKLFIIQACRNNRKNNNSSTPAGVSSDGSFQKTPMMRLMSVSSETDANRCGTTEKNHSHADMLLAFSTAIENISFRLEMTGGLFIQTLVEVFREKAYTTSVTDMLIEVNNKLREKYRDLEQIGAHEVILTKNWYLNPITK